MGPQARPEMQFLSYAGYLAKGIPTTVLVFIVAYLLTIAFAFLVLKDTALVSMITIADVAFRAQELRMLTLDSTSVYTLSLLIYFAISLAVVFVLRLVERRVRPRYLHRSAAWLGSLP